MKRAKIENINTIEYWNKMIERRDGYHTNVRNTGLSRYKEVIKHINKDSKILEVGCNFGDFFKYMKEEKIKFKSYNGSDFSPSAIKFAKTEFPEYAWKIEDCQEMEIVKNKYNTIVAMQMLEHIEKPKAFITNAYNILEKDGKIILTVPNGTLIRHPSHVWFFNANDIKTLLYDAGFREIEITLVNDTKNIVAIAKKLKKITVVTPVLCPSEAVFNVIQKCFKSIRAAVDEVNGEWIVVDDGSLVGKDFFKDIADIYIDNGKTIGVSYSLNKGMKNSKSDFLVKLDSDYLVPPNLFNILLKDWTDDLCFIAPSYTWGKQKEESNFDIKQIPIPEGGIIDKPSGMCKFSVHQWGGGVMMFSKKALQDVDYFDEEFGVGGGQDNDIIYRMLMKGYNWRWTNNVLTRHFASISSNDPNAPDSRAERRAIGRKMFVKKHGFEPGGFISKVFQHYKYDNKHLL